MGFVDEFLSSDGPVRAPPTRAKRGTARPEARLQMACVKWLRIRAKRGDLRFISHAPERSRSKPQQGFHKMMGLQAGIPDLQILQYEAATCRRRVIWVELKAPDGQLSDSQKQWRDWLTEHGWTWACVRAVDELVTLVDGA